MHLGQVPACQGRKQAGPAHTRKAWATGPISSGEEVPGQLPWQCHCAAPREEEWPLGARYGPRWVEPPSASSCSRPGAKTGWEASGHTAS